MTMSILVIAELREGELSTRHLPGHLRRSGTRRPSLGGSFDILLLGPGRQGGRRELKAYGAEKVSGARRPALAEYTAEAHGPPPPQLVRARGYKAVAGRRHTTGKDLMPRLAGLLDAGMVSDVVGFETGTSTCVPCTRATPWRRVAVDTPVAVLTVRETAFDAAQRRRARRRVAERRWRSIRPSLKREVRGLPAHEVRAARASRRPPSSSRPAAG